MDIRRGIIEVRGPFSAEEKEKQDYYKGLLIEWRETRRHYEEILAQPLEHDMDISQREFVAEELAQCNKIIPMLEELSGEMVPRSLFHADKLEARKA